MARKLHVPSRMRPADLVARIRSLASLPSTYQAVKDAIGHRNSSADLIAEAVKTDPSLSARVLRIANSAYYGYPRRVDNLRQAIVIIGSKQIEDVVAASLAIKQFKDVSPELVDMRSFWRHSLATALAAKSLAALRREVNTDRAFLIGLLHDIGSLVIYQQEAALASQALKAHTADKLPLEQCERTVFGFDHAAVSAALLEAWRLPSGIKEAVGQHHSGRWKADEPGPLMVHVADAVAHALGVGTNGETGVPPLMAGEWAGLGLSEQARGAVENEVTAQLEEAEALFLAE